MEATLNSSLQPFPDLKMLENFFAEYPPERVERLLWRWVLACIRHDFNDITEEEFFEFSEFFAKLQQLEIGMLVYYSSQLKPGQG